MLSQRVPFEQTRERPGGFPQTDITAKCSADRRGSSLSARSVSELPTTRRVTRPVNTSAFAGANRTGELITSGLPVILHFLRLIRTSRLVEAHRRKAPDSSMGSAPATFTPK